MITLIPNDEKFWREAAKYHSAVESENLRVFFGSVLRRPDYQLRAGGLGPDESPTIQIHVSHRTHGIRPERVFVCAEVRPAKSAVGFWIQYHVHPDLDPLLEARLRSTMGSDKPRKRKWHWLDVTGLDAQIRLVQAALDEVSSFRPLR